MAQNSTAPFAPFEWMIAWRYLRARRAEVRHAKFLRFREGRRAQVHFCAYVQML